MLIVVHDEEIGQCRSAHYLSHGLTLLAEPNAIRMNIIASRSKFEQLQTVSLSA